MNENKNKLYSLNRILELLLWKIATILDKTTWEKWPLGAENLSRKPLAQQYYYSNFPLPLPLFKVEFRKSQFLGKRLGATNNIELGECGGRGGGETLLLAFSHKEALLT